MKILLTGSTGYIGKRLLPLLMEAGHEVVCLVRDPSRLKNILPEHQNKIKTIAADLEHGVPDLPKDLDAAYYLIHSMADDPKKFEKKEQTTAENFTEAINKTDTKQVIYLSGLITASALSPHLRSRQKVERILHNSPIALTTLRAGIIIGSSSASFEIVRDLGEKLPFMVAPKWVNSLCQPISIDDALYYLTAVLGKKAHYQKTYDIGGPSIITYGQMLKTYAKTRKLKRFIMQVPVLSPKLSSYWLYFITSTNFSLAMALIESVKNNAICTEDNIHKLIPHKCFKYKEAVNRCFSPISQTSFFSTLEEAKKVTSEKPYLKELIRIPRHGCYNYSYDHKKFKTNNLKEFASKHTRWLALKETDKHLIFYRKKRKEYWIEYILTQNGIEKKLWHRPRGLYQRAVWYLYLGIKGITQKKDLKLKSFFKVTNRSY